MSERRTTIRLAPRAGASAARHVKAAAKRARPARERQFQLSIQGSGAFPALPHAQLAVGRLSRWNAVR